MNSDLQQIEAETDRAYAAASDVEYDPLTTAWGGIVLAGGFFPVIVFLVVVTYFAFSQGLTVSLQQLQPEIVVVIPGLAAAFCIGLVYAAIMSIPAILLLQLFRLLTNWMLTNRGACGVFGGLTGFLCSTGCGSFAILGPGGYDLRHLVIISTATAIGHLGAVLAGFLHRRQTSFPFYSPLLDPNKRVSIKFIMRVTVGIAILVVGFKAMGPTGLVMGIGWSSYAVFQIALLLLESRVVKFIDARS
jgi:hypothetical protein